MLLVVAGVLGCYPAGPLAGCGNGAVRCSGETLLKRIAATWCAGMKMFSQSSVPEFYVVLFQQGELDVGEAAHT